MKDWQMQITGENRALVTGQVDSYSSIQRPPQYGHALSLARTEHFLSSASWGSEYEHVISLRSRGFQ